MKKQNNNIKSLAGLFFISLLISIAAFPKIVKSEEIKTPLDMKELEQALSFAQGKTGNQKTWPRTITYTHDSFDFKNNRITRNKKHFEIKQKPVRIIAHSTGVAEILWAICPRNRILAYNKVAANPSFCFIAHKIKGRFPIFHSGQTELIIGYQPDLVFTVFYSSAAFKEKLKQARISFFDLGYFGTLESIKEQILLISEIIGEQGNGEALVQVMDKKIGELKEKISGKFQKSASAHPYSVLFYNQGGYVTGKLSGFTSMCEIIGVKNSSADQGIKSLGRIDFETLLKWNPDFIIVPSESGLKQRLTKDPILSHAQAVKNGRVREMPDVFLNAGSQYLILSANLLAGIVYENIF